MSQKKNASSSNFEFLYPWDPLHKLGYDSLWNYDKVYQPSTIFRVPSGELHHSFKSVSPQHKEKTRSASPGSHKNRISNFSKLNKNVCEIDSSKDIVIESEIKNQDEHLKNEFGLIRHKIVPDGNCLYRAVAQALVHDQSMHLIMRHEAVEHIRKNKQEFKKVIEGNIDSFIKEAEKESVWASFSEILALTQLLDINIIIVTGGSPTIPKVHVTCHHFEAEGQTPVPRDTLWLSWLSSGHYDVILSEKMENPEYLEWEKCKNIQIESDQAMAIKLSRRNSCNIDKELCDSMVSTDISDCERKESIQKQMETDETLARRLQEQEDFEDLYA